MTAARNMTDILGVKILPCENLSFHLTPLLLKFLMNSIIIYLYQGRITGLRSIESVRFTLGPSYDS